MFRCVIGLVVVLALVSRPVATAGGDDGAAKKPDPTSPGKKTADPIAMLREEGVKVSDVGPDGKELPPEQKAALAVSILLERAHAYSFTLTVKGADGAARVDVRETPDRERNRLEDLGKGRWQADLRYGNRVAPLIVRNAFTAGGDGDVRMTVALDKDRTFELSSKSAADGVYAVQALGLSKPFTDWLDKLIPQDGDDVVVLEGPGLQFPEFPSVKLGAQEVPADKEEWKKVVETAQSKYNEKRAELIKRMNRSYLYYAALDDAKSWSIRRAGDALFVRTGCSDLMFTALFEVEFRLADGKWKYVKLHATEWFKGE